MENPTTGCLRSAGNFLLWFFGSSIIAGLISEALKLVGVEIPGSVIVFPVAIVLGFYMWRLSKKRKANR